MKSIYVASPCYAHAHPSSRDEGSARPSGRWEAPCANFPKKNKQPTTTTHNTLQRSKQQQPTTTDCKQRQQHQHVFTATTGWIGSALYNVVANMGVDQNRRGAKVQQHRFDKKLIQQHTSGKQEPWKTIYKWWNFIARLLYQKVY